MTLQEESGTAHMAGFVALIGRPNVGKSTLVNALAGQKIAIVSPKPQTTRTRIQAILNQDGAQVILVDTPGMTDAVDALRRAMRRVAYSAAAGADVALVIVEVHGDQAEISKRDREIVEAARQGQGGIVVAINKIDKLPNKDVLLPWIDAYSKETGIEAVVPISAQRKDGLDAVLKEVVARLPESPPLFPQDLLTDQAERFICAELVREQMLLKLREEVPHSAAVIIETFDDERDESKSGGLCHLTGRIVVARDSQKGIVVGRRGSMIKEISTEARKEIELLLGCRVYLRLAVHVDKDWTRSERAVRSLGYDGEEA